MTWLSAFFLFYFILFSAFSFHFTSICEWKHGLSEHVHQGCCMNSRRVCTHCGNTCLSKAMAPCTEKHSLLGSLFTQFMENVGSCVCKVICFLLFFSGSFVVFLQQPIIVGKTELRWLDLQVNWVQHNCVFPRSRRSIREHMRIKSLVFVAEWSEAIWWTIWLTHKMRNASMRTGWNSKWMMQ